MRLSAARISILAAHNDASEVNDCAKRREDVIGEASAEREEYPWMKLTERL
jgi:hypothetical protein